MKKILIIAACLFMLTACGSNVEGTYSDDSGAFKLSFDGDGYVTMTTKMMGVENKQTFEYTVDGNKIKLIIEGNSQIVPINDDGSIIVMGTQLNKED